MSAMRPLLAAEEWNRELYGYDTVCSRLNLGRTLRDWGHTRKR